MSTAADFETIEVPNIGSYGRMVPVHAQAAFANVGASWVVTAYAVPNGRVFALDAAMVTAYGGTLPTYTQILIYTAGGSLTARLTRDPISGVNLGSYLRTRVWVPSGATVRFANGGGDATTDMLWSLSGRLFDWTDFAA